MTKRDLARQLLERAGAGGVTTSQFLRAGVGSRFGARLQELRDQGFDISSERVRDGEHRYILRGRPSSPGPVAQTPQSGEADAQRPGAYAPDPKRRAGAVESPSGCAGSALFELPAEPLNPLRDPEAA